MGHAVDSSAAVVASGKREKISELGVAALRPAVVEI
jgi:hypothetical protein